MITITYKTSLIGSKPYPTLPSEQYLEKLRQNRHQLHDGTWGIYLGRKIIIEGQELYFPFIDIDGDTELDGDEKLKSSILNARLTAQTFKMLKVDHLFKFIATGGSGFRCFSHILFNRETYLAFIQFVKNEMPHISDTAPTEDIEMPHQLFAYKGKISQSQKYQVDRHSVLIPQSQLLSDTFTVDTYEQLTGGKPDPDTFIRETESFFNDLKIITDLNCLGRFGSKLEQYIEAANAEKIIPFGYKQFKPKVVPLSMEVLQDRLREMGIRSKIEMRGTKEAISFTGLPCPFCGSTTCNPRAYAPSYRLGGFSANCECSKKAIPLHQWSGIDNQWEPVQQNHDKENLTGTIENITIESARERICDELHNSDSVSIIVTPGVGKTTEAIKYLATNILPNTVIYSCPTKQLRDQAFNKAQEIASEPEKVFSLGAREDLCLRKNELTEITKQGFSPSQILCRSCDQSKQCTYKKQRTNIGHGLYFVTHSMLPYLNNIIPSPDKIILDENPTTAFMVKEKCSVEQMRTLFKVFRADKDKEQLLEIILDYSNKFASQITTENKYSGILNGQRRIDSGHKEDSLVELIAHRQKETTVKIENDIAEAAYVLSQYPHRELYEKGVAFKAYDWIQALNDKNSFAYIEATPDGKAVFKLKKIRKNLYPDVPLKLLDATGHIRLTERLTGRRIRSVAADVKWNSTRVHIYKSTSRATLEHASDADLKTLAKEALKHISGDKILLITYLRINGNPFAERLKNICQKVAPTKHFDVHHYQGSRGINTYKDFDSVLCIGLPYVNLSDNWQDAWLFFPDESDEDLRNSWSDLCMKWELFQAIHRSRPVNKENVEIVIVANQWPTILPEPNKVIDKSQNGYWKEIAIERLLPYVQQFGFLNPDIGYLAGVYSKERSKIADDFRQKLKGIPELPHSEKGQLACGNLLKQKGLYDKVALLKDVLPVSKDKRSINGLNNIYTKNWASIINSITKKHSYQSQQESSDSVKTNSCNNLILSNNNQWTQIVVELQARFPHFNKFQIKLPHAKGQKVSGIGNLIQVRKFYSYLNELKVFSETDVSSLEIIGEEVVSDYRIPDGIVVVQFTKDEKYFFVAWGDEREIISIDDPQLSALPLSDLLGNPDCSIITNDGKRLSKFMIQQGIKRRDIHDVVLNYRILNNGDLSKKTVLDKELFKEYGLQEDADVVLAPYQLFRVHELQGSQVAEKCLEATVNLERCLVWCIAKIETEGICVDFEGLQKYSDSLPANHKHQKIMTGILRRGGTDGRLHDVIDQVGQITGRMTSKIHNVPKGHIRSFFRAREGYKFINADYCQQETRIISALAQDATAMKIFQDGKDLYSEVADELKPYLPIGTGVCRGMGKAAVLGLINGGGAWSILVPLKKEYGITADEKSIEQFVLYFCRSLFPGISAWRKRIIREAYNKGFTQIMSGRSKKRQSDDSDASISNTHLQGNAADGLKKAIVAMDEKLRGLDARIIHTAHDEIIVEALESIADQVKIIVTECMENAFQDIFPNMPFPVDAEITDSWGG